MLPISASAADITLSCRTDGLTVATETVTWSTAALASLDGSYSIKIGDVGDGGFKDGVQSTTLIIPANAISTDTIYTCEINDGATTVSVKFVQGKCYNKTYVEI